MKTLRTIILDDNSSFRKSLGEMLRNFDFIEVLGEAGSEEEGMEAVKKYLPNLVITDIRLPGLNGFEFARAVKSRFPATQVIFVTLFDSIIYQQEAARLGFPYVPKGSLLEKLPPLLERLSGMKDDLVKKTGKLLILSQATMGEKS